ncbi:MAG: energy-coupling factor transporter transmembrane protein EcfT [Eubacterium sp.]|nr:energy-coupling factor transporter transmembrane protein EcfT [Eubacterium sp.]
MIRNMTIGTYYPVDSPIHRLDPRIKLIAVLVFLVSLFLFSSFTGYFVVTFCLLMTVCLSRVPVSHIFKGMRAIVFLLIFTSIFNLFFTSGDILWEWQFIHITYQGVRQTIFMAMRLIYLVVGSSMLTYTSTPGQLTEAIESLLSWLKVFRVPVHDFAMMLSLALRFIPLLLSEANRILDAQNARGADIENAGFMKKMRSMVSILVPLLVSATRRAYELGLAMEARCYSSTRKNTKMKPLRMRVTDFLMLPVMVGYVVAIIYVDRNFML